MTNIKHQRNTSSAPVAGMLSPFLFFFCARTYQAVLKIICCLTLAPSITAPFPLL